MLAALLLSILFLCAARAEAASPSVAAPSVGSHEQVLAAALALAAAGRTDSARLSLQWLLEQEITPDLQRRAERELTTLPRSLRNLRPAMELAVWQSALGAYLLGPHLARLSYDPSRSAAPYFAGAAAGALAGTGSAIWLSAGTGLDQGRSTTIMTAQQLGGFNGAAIGWLVHDGDVPWAAGLLVGVGIGTAGGYLLALSDPDPGLALAAQSGMVWGLGLGLATAVVLERWDRQLMLCLLVCSDLGVAVAFSLARWRGASRQQVWMADLGGLLGTGSGLLVVGFLYGVADTGHRVNAIIVTAMGLAGGATGALLAERLARARKLPVATALLSGRFGRARLGLPLPRIQVASDGFALALPLVDCRF